MGSTQGYWTFDASPGSVGRRSPCLVGSVSVGAPFRAAGSKLLSGSVRCRSASRLTRRETPPLHRLRLLRCASQQPGGHLACRSLHPSLLACPGGCVSDWIE
eukprot:scaffold102_cov340-Pavlova_lutheri.AAC.6